jgi:serine/threonine protein kinase
VDEQTIFSQAIGIESAEERATFLDSACGADRELRARIEKLLRLQEDAGSFLEKPIKELAELAETQRDESATEFDDRWKELLEPSDEPNSLGRLGSYEIAELIGRGGMGIVLRAFDSKLKRTVAIKILAPELAANAMAVRRFLREAQAAAAVSHDHVVTIHAIDELARPPRIVMEFVAGQSLQQKIDNEGALDLKSILRIGMQTASGLSAAHKQGLVHRDIKPSNILLENGIERVKLTDFGLARAVDDIGVTQTGQITGTPQYMSPEQAQGHRVDHRTDLFSLGCVLYAMCTGRAAFRADSAVAVMHRVVHDTPRPIRDANDEIPEWLCEIVDKLLEKNPEDRFASAREVEELLGQHLAHLQQPESAPRPERVRMKSPAREIPLPPTFIRTLLNFWMTPQPEFARRVGKPVMWFVGVWLFSLLLVMIGQAPEFVQMLVLSTGFTGVPLLILVLSVSASRAARNANGSGKSADASHDRPPRRGFSQVPLFALIALLLGAFGVGELTGTTHSILRTIDNFNRQGRIELTSLGGNVTVRGPNDRSLQTEILAQGLGSPDRTRSFSTPLYPGRYEVQFYSDKHTMTGLKEIEIVRGGIVRVHAPQGIEQVDLAQSGPVMTGSGIPFEFRQIDRLLVVVCLLATFTLVWLIRIRNRGLDRRAAIPRRLPAAALLLLTTTLAVILLIGLVGVPRPVLIGKSSNFSPPRFSPPRNDVEAVPTTTVTPQQWKELISQAASIPLNEWNTLAGDIKGPNAVAVRGEPLSLVLLNLDPFAEQKQNEHVIRDFWYLTETLPKPQELANAISVSKDKGYVSFLQPERMTNLTFEEADGTVEGSVGFSVPKLYSGRVEFMARRYYDNIWRIDEFRLPHYDITLRRNTQNLWQKVRTNRISGNRTEGSRSSP